MEVAFGKVRNNLANKGIALRKQEEKANITEFFQLLHTMVGLTPDYSFFGRRQR